MLSQAIQDAHFETKNNSKLPFDILYPIFSHYSEDETPESPLETLLLVCCFWKEAALEHRLIWSRFKIEIENESDAIQWKERIDRRLERSGPNSPIFFRLHQESEFPRNYNPIAVEIIKLIDAVVGSSGSLCARWKEIDLNLHNIHFNSKDKCFTYPTPILTSLRLKKMSVLNESASSSDYPFFPSAPMLENFVVSECKMIIFPDITNTTSIELHHCSSYANFSDNITDLSILAEAKRLEHLTLDYYYGAVPYNLPRVLPSPTSLYLGAGNLPTNMGDAEFPALRHLSVELTVENATLLLKCHGIPFHQLKTLKIILDLLDLYIEDEYLEESQNACLALLKECRNIVKILCDESSRSMIGKVLKEDSTEDFVLFPEGVSIIEIDRERTIYVTADRSEREKIMDVLSAELAKS